MRVLRSQVQYINSLDRQDGEYINNFTITYPNNFISVEPDQYVRMSLVSFATYNYFFWTNRYNNAFNINGVTYFLPIGFYTPVQNMANFLALLNASPLSLGVVSITSQPDGTYKIVNGPNPWTLSFEGRDPTYLKINAALLLGFNVGGNYPFNTSQSTSVTVPYSFSFAPGQEVITPAPPISGELQNIIVQMSVPPQNVGFDTITGYMNYVSSFAYIPANGYAKYAPIVYNPQDTGTWTWQSPSQGSKLGTIRYILVTPAYQELPMVADYTMGIKVDIMIDDATEQMKLMRQSLKLQKLLLIQNDHHHQDAQAAPEPEAEPEPEPSEETQDGGTRETEDQLHEGPLDYYGNNLYYD